MDLSDKKSLARLQAILSGNADNPFPQFTVAELEACGIFRGNILLQFLFNIHSHIISVIPIRVKVQPLNSLT